MDTSKEYIEMCDCPEIQDAWKPVDGDMFARKACVAWDNIEIDGARLMQTAEDGYYSCVPVGMDEYGDGEPTLSVWLPRQDQLQEMVFEYDLTHCVSDAVNDGQYRGQDLTSMEQLWLAFVMKEKFNKTWIEGGWK